MTVLGGTPVPLFKNPKASGFLVLGVFDFDQ
jgi:hypothetical protein